MAKSLLGLEARKLRSNGMSINSIASKLKVARSSVGYWVADIVLTEEQLVLLKQSELSGKEKGRLKSAILKKENRKKVVDNFKNLGRKQIQYLSKQELLLVGLALYWGEGSKGDRDRRVEFCNSDATMIQLLVKWLIVCFKVNKGDLRLVVGINQIHAFREKEVKDYWSNILDIPIKQFRKSSFKKVKSKKIYDNLDRHFGTLTIRVAKSTNLYYKIMGLIHGLHLAKINQLAA